MYEMHFIGKYPNMLWSLTQHPGFAPCAPLWENPEDFYFKLSLFFL